MALKSHMAQYFARLDMISLSAYLSFAADLDFLLGSRRRYGCQ